MSSRSRLVLLGFFQVEADTLAGSAASGEVGRALSRFPGLSLESQGLLPTRASFVLCLANILMGRITRILEQREEVGDGEGPERSSRVSVANPGTKEFRRGGEGLEE